MVRLLLIDDTAQDRLLLTQELRRIFPGLCVQEAATEAEFQAALEAGDFDLTITEYQLSWGNGLAVLYVLKGRYPDRPVIMFTAGGTEEVAVEAMKAGLDDYVLRSPRHYLRLAAAVRSALDKAEARRRAQQAESERLQMLAREQAARAEAERLYREAREADRKKDEFLAMLAHELRNPLSPILNALHLLGNPRLESDAIELAREMMQRQVKHMARLVDDLLDVSRITKGKIQLRRERVDLAHLVRATAEDLRGTVEAAGLRLSVNTPGEPVSVLGDPTRLAQVVGNLVQNSAKFTEAGGWVAVRLTTDGSRQRAVVQVEDSGVGIEPEMLDRLFEVFTQADRSLHRSRGGLGLGLALVRGLVALHDGDVSATSEGPGRGSTFTFWLPLYRERRTVVEAPGAATVSGNRFRVLIVEDNRDAAESLRMVLVLSGHEVAVAHTGPAGVEMAKEFRPDVVLCDLGLPGGLNGYEVAQVLRKTEATAGARLVAVSGYGQPEDQERARAAGFDLHLTKPVSPDDLQHFLAGRTPPP